MSKLKQPISLNTAFNEYTIDEQIGEGGSGRVYAGKDNAGESVAVKVLTQSSSDKRKRFKNEIAFLMRNKHKNIVTVNDFGIASTANLNGPFYVMRRYSGSLRDELSKGIQPSNVLKLFAQILDGVEAAHLLGVTHRDLKPENILFDNSTDVPAVADFGIANFSEDTLATMVETGPTQRLANFIYAAPEQRGYGKKVLPSADIYALGLMLNEMFTGSVPHGTDYSSIEGVAKEFAYLDRVVANMIKQNPSDRPESIAAIKMLIQKYHAEAISLQKLSAITNTVVKMGEIDDPLALEPPKLIGANWDDGILRLTLDRPVTPEWIEALNNMGSYSSIMGLEPHSFQFRGAEASASVPEHSAQAAIDHFKQWLPRTTLILKERLTAKARQKERHQIEQLRREREAEERRLRVNGSLRI
jgi:eukaryotic-like serine/threonine-protein kinase